jgi:hypothetical protein
MPRKKHPIVPVLEFFRAQPREVCELTLQIVKDLVALRFTGSSIPATASPRKRKTTGEALKQLSLPFTPEDGGVKEK